MKLKLRLITKTLHCLNHECFTNTSQFTLVRVCHCLTATFFADVDVCRPPREERGTAGFNSLHLLVKNILIHVTLKIRMFVHNHVDS